MANYIETARNFPELEAELFNSSQRAVRFFEANGYNLVRGDRRDTHPLKERFEAACGDDRYVNNGGNNLSFGKAGRASLIGGLYLVMAEITGGNASSVGHAQEYAQDRGVILTHHGDDQHGEEGCKMFEMWSMGKLNSTYTPNFGPDIIIKEAKTRNIPYHVLNGPHSVEMLSLNFLPLTAARRTPDKITHDYGVSHVLGIEDDSITRLVFDLSTELNINTIEIIA